MVTGPRLSAFGSPLSNVGGIEGTHRCLSHPSDERKGKKRDHPCLGRGPSHPDPRGRARKGIPNLNEDIQARDEKPTPKDPDATAMDTTVSDANPPTQMQGDKDRPTHAMR